MISLGTIGGSVVGKLWNSDSQINTLFDEFKETLDFKRISINQLGKCRKHWPAKISDEERDQIAKIALWNSIRKYDSRHGTKFTSYLTAQIKFEYMNYVNKYNAGDDELTFADMKEYKDIATYNHNYDEVDIKELINRLPPKVRKIVSMRYYGKYTLSEIGSQLNYSPERIRQLVVEGLKEMHEDAERVAA